MPSIINATTTNGVAISPDNSGSLQLATNNGATAVTIDTNQNVGIGTTSPINYGSGNQGLTINGTGNYQNITWRVNGVSVAAAYTNGTAGFLFGTENSSPLQFQTAGTERMRITSGGALLVGTTSETPGYGNTNTGQQLGGSSVSTFSRGATDYVISCNQNTVDGSTYYQVVFRVSNVTKGTITSTSSATSYNTSSDYRLKENIAPMTGALTKVQALKPVTYNWKVDGSAGQGFIAHEVAEVVPDAVTGEKDAVNSDGSIKPQQIDTSFLVATLTAAIQEQQAMIETLKTELDTVKVELNTLKNPPVEGTE